MRGPAADCRCRRRKSWRADWRAGRRCSACTLHGGEVARSYRVGELRKRGPDMRRLPGDILLDEVLDVSREGRIAERRIAPIGEIVQGPTQTDCPTGTFSHCRDSKVSRRISA